MSHVTCHVSHFTCHISRVICHTTHFFCKMVKLVGGGSVINGATPFIFYTAIQWASEQLVCIVVQYKLQSSQSGMYCRAGSIWKVARSSSQCGVQGDPEICWLYTIQLYSCTVYTVYCTFFIIHHTLYTVHTKPCILHTFLNVCNDCDDRFVYILSKLCHVLYCIVVFYRIVTCIAILKYFRKSGLIIKCNEIQWIKIL